MKSKIIYLTYEASNEGAVQICAGYDASLLMSESNVFIQKIL